MQVPQTPDNEAQRLDMLYALAMLDTPPEERFDRITRLARFMFDVPIALLSLVDTSRQWFKSKQGVTQCETHRDISFCGHAILQNDIFEIPDATLDQRFANNPMVTAEQGIRFYAGVPLILNDVAIGMLCIKDYKARCLTQEQKTAFKELSAIVLAELVIDMQSRENHALRAKQQELLRFARVAEQSSSAVVITDTAGYVQWVNAEFSRMSGYPLAELINRKPGSVLQGPASDPHTIAQMRQALQRQQGFEVDIINYLPNGSPYWAHIKCNPIFDELGSLQGFMAIETDITSQKSFAEQLQQQLHALEILNDIATTSETDWAFQLEGALAKAAKYLKMELALINIIEGDKAIVHTLYPTDCNGVKKGQHFVLAETYCDITMQTGDIVVITQMSQSPYRVHSCFQHFALESFLGIPLLLADKQIGSLSFAAALPRSEPFNTAELLFFRLFARWISSAMERQQVTQLVQYNEHRLRSLFELSPIGIALNDYQTGKFIDLNQALVNATG